MGVEKKLITTGDLKSYFFQGLDELNNKSLCPVPQETIFYSSTVMDRFASSEVYFELNEGRVREKILGIKLLEAGALPTEAQRRTYQEIGDTALMICGYFSESVNKKIVDQGYYAQLGKMAYGRLNAHMPRYLDVPGFYQVLASSFGILTTLIGMMASRDRFADENHLLLKRVMENDATEQEKLVGRIISDPSKKVS